MTKIKSRLLSAALSCLIVLTSWQCARVLDQPTVEGPSLATAKSFELIEPIPFSVALDPGQVALGRKLFHDPQLSADNSLSCASCHDLAKGGTDQSVSSTGINRQVGPINAPTVLNAGFQFKQFWDGRAESLEEQAGGPIMAAGEMGSSGWPEVIGKLEAKPEYVSAFSQSYPDGVTETNIRDAIAEFERSLYTPNSRFDQFLRGDENALTADEKEGYRLFKSNNCTSCHNGVLLGGNSFQKMGRYDDYFKERGNITDADYGRFNVTGKEADRFFFKVPTLRNVALTFPYFHDGSAKTLEEAVSVMIQYQLGQEPNQQDVELIAGFLKTLTGKTVEG